MSTGRHRSDFGHWTAEQMRAGVEHANVLAEQLERIAEQHAADRAARAAELRAAKTVADRHAADLAREHARLVEMLEGLPGAHRANRCSGCDRDIGDETHMIEKDTGLSVCTSCDSRRDRVERRIRRDAERRRADAAEWQLQEARRAEVAARQRLLYTAQGVRYERRHLRMLRLLWVVFASTTLVAVLANPLFLILAAAATYMMINTVRGLRAELRSIAGPPGPAGIPRVETYRHDGLPSRAKVRHAEHQHAAAIARHDRALLRVLDAEAKVPAHVAWPEIFPAP